MMLHQTSSNKWDRAGYNHRSQLSSSLLDIRWRLIQYFSFSKFTYYNHNLNAITPFEIIGAIFIYILVIFMSVIGHENGNTSQFAIFIAVIIVCRFNLLQLLMGVSWERALLFHKVFSMSSLIAGIIHGTFSLVSPSTNDSPRLFSC